MNTRTQPINSRAKGAAAEREFARLVHDHLGVTLTRNLEQTRNGGYDLIALGDCPVSAALNAFAIECKRYGTITPALLVHFWDQAERQAQAAGKVPVLAYRADRQDWRITLPLHVLNAEAYEPWTGYGWTADVSVPAFCTLVLEKTAANLADTPPSLRGHP